MKGNKSTYLILLVMMLSLTPGLNLLKAQPYMHAAGIRAGYSSGITYKGFRLHRKTAFELDILYNRNGFNLAALYEYHLEPFQSKRTFVYLGGGVFGGDWKK